MYKHLLRTYECIVCTQTLSPIATKTWWFPIVKVVFYYVWCFFPFELFITFKFVYKTSLMRKKTYMKCGKQWIILQDNSKNDVGKCVCDMRSENRIFRLDQNSVESSNMERFTHVRFTYILCVRFNCLPISLYKLTTMHIPTMAFALKHIIQSWIERKIKWLNVFEN